MDSPRPPTAPATLRERRGLGVAAAVTALAIALLGFGLLRLVRWLQGAPPAEVAAEVGSRGGGSGAAAERRGLLAQTPRRSGEEEPPAVPPEHPFARTQVTGRVYDLLSGEGIGGARVRVRPAPGIPRLGPAGGDGTAVFTSRPDGGFALRGIPPGSFELEVEAEGYLAVRSGFKKFSALEDDDGFDFGLVPGRMVQGRVTTQDGQPVQGARVVSVTEGGPGAQHAESDAEGFFVLEPVDARGAELLATHPDFGVGAAMVRDEEPVRIVLEASRVVAGRVSGPQGPVEGALVRVALALAGERLYTRIPRDAQAQTTSGSDGGFRLAVPASGPAGLVVEAAGYVPARVTLTEERAEAFVEVRIEPGRELRGVILDDTGGPAGGARVIVAPLVRARGRPEAAEAWSDASGRFTVRGLPEVEGYNVRVFHPLHPDLAVVERELAGERTYRLEPQARIEGRLVDALTGGPVTRYAWAVRGPIHRWGEAVSVSGAFEADQLSAGIYTLSIEAEGYEPVQLEGVVAEAGGRRSSLEIRLRPAGGVRGLVRGGEGAVMVQAWNARGELEAEAAAGPDGSFALTDLSSGLFRLVAGGPSPRGALLGTLDNVPVESGRFTEGIELRVAPIEGRP